MRNHRLRLNGPQWLYCLVLGLVGTATHADVKVTICHYPPGNPANAHELSISSTDVPEHLAHGDFLGPCSQDCRRHPTVCDDSNVCTTDTCSASGACTHAPVSCDDSLACTTDSCDPLTGCHHDPVVCDDGSQCTTDACDPNTGLCTFGTVSCDDQNLCTADSCSAAGGCAHTPVNCDDQNVCTADSCTATGGCQYTPVSCDDGDQCTDDSCNPATGCTHLARSCDDNDKCTVDSCSTAEGCTHTPVTCSSGSICNPSTGGCVALQFTLVQSFTSHCVPFNYQNLLSNVPASAVTYEDAFNYCALQCINDPSNGGCNQIWVSYNQLGPPKSGPYWCLYGAGPETSNFDNHWTASEIQCNYPPIPTYADWYSRP